MGEWLKENGFAIYGTRGGPFKPSDWGVSTRKGNTIYLHVLNLPGTSTKIVLPDFGMEISGCRVAGGEALNFSKANGEILIEFGNAQPDSVDTILEIMVKGDVMDIPPLDVRPASLSFNKPVSGSSNPDAHWSNHQWVDIKSVTNGDWSGDFWHPAEEDALPWLEIDLGSRMNVKGATLYERGNNIFAYEIQHKAGDEWETVYTGNKIGEKAVVDFPGTEMQQLRLLIKEFTGVPCIYEIALF